MEICVGILDDHVLVLEGLKEVVNSCHSCDVVFTGGSSADFSAYVSDSGAMPDVLLLDLHLGLENGLNVLRNVIKQHPELIVLMLTMDSRESNIISAIRSGAKGYLLKDLSPEELCIAIKKAYTDGHYYTEEVNNVIIKTLNAKSGDILSEREIEFIKFACSEYTYKEIASLMHVSPRTIDGYREALFSKLNVKNRIGLVLYAIETGIVRVGSY